MTFKRPATDRQLTFEEVSRETHIPMEEVSVKYFESLIHFNKITEQLVSETYYEWLYGINMIVPAGGATGNESIVPGSGERFH